MGGPFCLLADVLRACHFSLGQGPYPGFQHLIERGLVIEALGTGGADSHWNMDGQRG